ncbi:Oxoglutarate/iron-dependent dioxygenase [Penicillium longicatenatum]|uniref:Oxoglutarate/iron-dependent dioxygenase n=1 Tax=Penicillium longicatenatum TaxID=1561947 RepID=UPI0025487166|nr:Oxoglutarate/iron-dependent dioxygenase [Penicillium longicatenatum]KAJ5649421.1 Oxoglutarate/iron-dependent dioxygenase [Penicillium longicatenatum]
MMFEQLDFARFYHKSIDERDQFCRELITGLRNSGWVRLVNHGIPSSNINQTFEASQKFFKLPLEQKLKSPHPLTAHPHRGFSPVGLENISAVSNYRSSATQPLLRDMKETYDIGSEQDPLYSNIWPPAGILDGFQMIMNSFFSVCYDAELKILDAISIGLGLPVHALRELHVMKTNELRLSHYPEVDRAEFANATRIAAHTDFGTITLLFQDDVGGLEMEYPCGSGLFVPAESCGRYECILNVGDCLQMWTGLHSARHRVHVAAKNKNEGLISERFSIAYFAKPDRSAILRPLVNSPAAESQPIEKFMTANEFQHMRIEGTYAQ